MKKLLVFLLTLSMIMGMTLSANAATVTTIPGTDSAEVKATYNDAEGKKTIYSVDITWENLSFQYNEAVVGTWNVGTHVYDGSAPAGWQTGTGTITVTNHSNAGITATPTYAQAEEYESVNMIFTKTSLSLDTADNGKDGAAGTPTSGTITVTPNGALPEGAKDTVIGTITVEIK